MAQQPAREASSVVILLDDERDLRDPRLRHDVASRPDHGFVVALANGREKHDLPLRIERHDAVETCLGQFLAVTEETKIDRLAIEPAHRLRDALAIVGAKRPNRYGEAIF